MDINFTSQLALIRSTIALSAVVCLAEVVLKTEEQHAEFNKIFEKSLIDLLSSLSGIVESQIIEQQVQSIKELLL